MSVRSKAMIFTENLFFQLTTTRADRKSKWLLTRVFGRPEFLRQVSIFSISSAMDRHFLPTTWLLSIPWSNHSFGKTHLFGCGCFDGQWQLLWYSGSLFWLLMATRYSVKGNRSSKENESNSKHNLLPLTSLVLSGSNHIRWNKSVGGAQSRNECVHDSNLDLLARSACIILTFQDSGLGNTAP